MLSSNTSAVSGDTKYIEDYFSSYLYTGTGSAQSIVNNIDLSTKGGLLWIKNRSTAHDHILTDTARGVNNYISSNLTAAQVNDSNFVSSANTNGFSIGTQIRVNATADQYASWSFAKATKFFDVVTYTGDGTNNRQISHSLGATPGVIFLKPTSTTGQWSTYHRSLGAGKYLALNSTDASTTDANFFPAVTSTYFSPVATASAAALNDVGVTYVAYLYAHNAGGFGLTGTDNVISCGSAVTNGSGSLAVTLGYEPQWVMVKNTTSAGGWYMVDTMRGFVASPGTTSSYLAANSSNAEASWGAVVEPTATGFNIASGLGGASQTIIYIAIRRGPMKVPTDATKVFYATTYSAPSLNTVQTVTTGFPVDSVWVGVKNNGTTAKALVQDRLRIANNTSTSNTLVTSAVYNEGLNGYVTFNIGNNTGYTLADSNGSWGGDSAQGWTPFSWSFRRAPSFFDEVCDKGTGSDHAITHNLGVKPELIIRKSRSGAANWWVYSATLTATKYLLLDDTGGAGTYSGIWSDTEPTASNFTVGSYAPVNGSGTTYVSYLFATCAGVSKVGSYTGTGTTKQVDCGFAAGARFVLIKRTDSTGDWYVWDTARGIVSGNDPYLLLNSTAAEVTSTDYIDTYSAGFELSSTAPAALNASGGSFVYLAIA